ncbi:MAG TPA: 3-oxoacyl-ACP reductase FabG [Candidatus Binatia bacterium]
MARHAKPDPSRLDGQCALVTGGDGGIGSEVSRALAQAGAAVAVNYRTNADAAQALVDEIRATGARALAVRADVTREDDVLAMVRRVEDELGPLDVLINNAGVQRDAAFHEMSLEDWNTVIAVNLTGQFLCAREATRAFLRHGVRSLVSRSAGKIVFVSSVHDVIPWAGHANYAAAKGGLAMLMKTLAQELAAHRIRVNAVSPGAIRTPINRDAWETPEAEGRLLELIPYGRIGEPTDVGRAVTWLVSDAADYVVGATLYVDGGMTLYPSFIGNG